MITHTDNCKLLAELEVVVRHPVMTWTKLRVVDDVVCIHTAYRRPPSWEGSDIDNKLQAIANKCGVVIEWLQSQDENYCSGQPDGYLSYWDGEFTYEPEQV